MEPLTVLTPKSTSIHDVLVCWPFHSKCGHTLCLPHLSLTQEAGVGRGEHGLSLGTQMEGTPWRTRNWQATVWLSQLTFTSCLLRGFTNHRNILALPWWYIQYLEIRCLANSPPGSIQNKMNNSSTSVRLKRQCLFVCTNPFSFLKSPKSQNMHHSRLCTFHCQGENSKWRPAIEWIAPSEESHATLNSINHSSFWLNILWELYRLQFKRLVQEETIYYCMGFLAGSLSFRHKTMLPDSCHGNHASTQLEHFQTKK